MGAIGVAATKPPQTIATPKTQAQQQPQQQQAARPRNAPKSFGDAKPMRDRNYLNEGKYTLRVNRVSQIWTNPKAVDDDRPQPTSEELKTAQPAFKKQDAFIVEVEVVASEPLPSAKDGTLPNKVGDVASVVFTDKYPESYFSGIKGFICAACNAEPEQVTLEDWQASYQPAQPLAGMLVDCVARLNGKGTFTNHIFTPNAEQHPGS